VWLGGYPDRAIGWGPMISIFCVQTRLRNMCCMLTGITHQDYVRYGLVCGPAGRIVAWVCHSEGARA
jgi:hypothetical protein